MQAIVAVWALMLAETLGAASGDPSPIARTFSFPDNRPIWVAASEAITPDGRLRPGVLRSGYLDSIERRRLLRSQQRAAAASGAPRPDGKATPDNGCDAEFAGRTHFAQGRDVKSLAELREAAAKHKVVSGVVTGAEAGFHGGMPTTVVRIQSHAAGSPSRQIHLLYPSGRLLFDGLTVCNHDPGYAPLPSHGDRIVVVLAARPFDADQTLYTTPGSWIVYEHGGTTVLSPPLRRWDPDLAGYTFERISNLLTQAAEQGRQ